MCVQLCVSLCMRLGLNDIRLTITFGHTHQLLHIKCKPRLKGNI